MIERRTPEKDRYPLVPALLFPIQWTPGGLKEYKITDHLGSTRIVLDGLGGIVSLRDYTPFGEDLGQTGIPIRRSYIDRQTDVETGLGAYGARSYIAKEARFGAIDPKWEQFRAHSPYHYSFNNPVLLKDPSGKNPAGVLVAFAADYAFEIGLTLIVTGAIVHHVTQTEYVGTNRGLSTSVAGPIPQRHFPLNPGLGKQLLHSLSSIDLLNLGTALQAMSESYGDDGPEEPAGDAPVPPVGGDAGTPEKTFEDILDGAQFTEKKSVKQYVKEGTYQDALDDFNAIVVPGKVVEIENGYRGELPDGRRIIARPSSTKEELPTLEQQRSDGTPKIKIRYKLGE